jgi:uncharacterized membrane protein
MLGINPLSARNPSSFLHVQLSSCNPVPSGGFLSRGEEAAGASSEESTMAFCSSCGTQMEGQFCPKCGAAAIAAPGTTSTQSASAVNTLPGLTINAASALCYLFGFVTGIIFLVLAPYNQDRRVRFHALQSIFLNVAVIVVHIGVTMVSLMFHAISFSLGIMMSSLHLLVSLGFFMVWLYMMYKSYQGEKVVLPFIGPLAERQVSGHDTPAGTIGKAA